MSQRSTLETAARCLAAGAAAAAAGYAAYVTVTWARYGHPAKARPQDADELLDVFMPNFEVAERHHIAVNAPADVTLKCAKAMNLTSSRIVRAIFTARQLLLRAAPDRRELPAPLMEEVQALGWGVLAETPGREIVIGAVTRPWEANVTFRAVRPEQFREFAEPDYVKIAWTLRADPVDDTRSVFRTETRAIATDARARSKFRLYWSCLSPGIIVIRRMMLAPLKRDAERAAAA